MSTRIKLKDMVLEKIEYTLKKKLNEGRNHTRPKFNKSNTSASLHETWVLQLNKLYKKKYGKGKQRRNLLC